MEKMFGSDETGKDSFDADGDTGNKIRSSDWSGLAMFAIIVILMVAQPLVSPGVHEIVGDALLVAIGFLSLRLVIGLVVDRFGGRRR